MDSVDSWRALFGAVASFLRDCERSETEERVERNKVEYICERLEVVSCSVRRLYNIISSTIVDYNNADIQDTARCLSSLLDDLTSSKIPYWRRQLQRLTLNMDATTVARCPRSRSSARGRPPFDVDPEQILFLRECGFTWVMISSILGISRMTLYRKRKEFGMEDLRFVCSYM